MAIKQASPETLLALDTNVLTAWRHSKQHTLQAIKDYQSRLKFLPALTSITVFEALHGLECKADAAGEREELMKRDIESTKKLIQSCEILGFDHAAAMIAAHICGRLSKNMSKDLLKDVFIAATALAHEYGVATRNQKDFELIGSHLPPTHQILRLAVWKP